MQYWTQRLNAPLIYLKNKAIIIHTIVLLLFATFANSQSNDFDKELDVFFADESNYQEYLSNIRKNDLKIPEIVIKRSWSNLPKNIKSWNVDWMPEDLVNTSPSLYKLILSNSWNIHPDILKYFQLVAEEKQLAAEESKLAAEESKLAAEESKLAAEGKIRKENADFINSIASNR